MESQDRVSDDHPSSSDDTAPLTASDDASWLPPREQQPPHQWAPPGPAPYGDVSDTVSTGRPYQPAASTQPYGVVPSSATPGRSGVPGWVWPMVSVLALIVGVVGGMVGGAAYENWHSSSREGQVGGGLADAGTVSQAPLPAGNHSVASVAQQLLPSTIQVLAQYQGKKDGATGSGFVLDRSGHYITNNHVVADAVSHDGPIEIVDQNGDTFPATVVGRSATYDLAVLYVKNGPRLPPASLGTAGVLRVGDQVVAFGSPLGLSSTVTSGIVSALNRPVTTSDSGSTSSYINAVQTDAAINPGNSGRPVGRPLRARGRGQLRDRHDRQQRDGAVGQHRGRLRDPDRPGQDHRRPDPAHGPRALPRHRSERRHPSRHRQRGQDPRRSRRAARRPRPG